MKKESTIILPPVSESFSKKVTALVDEGRELHQSYTSLTARMLQFAERFNELWQDAHRLDGNKDDGEHAAHFRTVLGKVVNTDNPSIWSRWNTIGKYSKHLLPHVGSLPPQRDALYELALASKNGKSLGGWIQSEKLSPDSSVRDVQALCRKKTRRSSARPPSPIVPPSHFIFLPTAMRRNRLPSC